MRQGIKLTGSLRLVNSIQATAHDAPTALHGPRPIGGIGDEPPPVFFDGQMVKPLQALDARSHAEALSHCALHSRTEGTVMQQVHVQRGKINRRYECTIECRIARERQPEQIARQTQACLHVFRYGNVHECLPFLTEEEARVEQGQGGIAF